MVCLVSAIKVQRFRYQVGTYNQKVTLIWNTIECRVKRFLSEREKLTEKAGPLSVWPLFLYILRFLNVQSSHSLFVTFLVRTGIFLSFLPGVKLI